MENLLIIVGGVFMILGLLGSFPPLLPGIPLSWTGLLLIHLTEAVPMNYTFLSITLLITFVVFGLQYIIPALGTRYFGGSKYGMIGATAGLIAGIFIPIPFAILIVPFGGAYIGELVNKLNSKNALKAASGSFLGLIASTFMEFICTLIFLILYLYKVAF